MKIWNGQIRCVKIVHTASDIKKYRVLSGFFRFIGIFVCEKTIENEKETDEETDYRIDTEFIEEKKEKEMIQTVVFKVFHLNRNEEQRKFKKRMERIIEIFADNELMRGSYAIAYFADTKDYMIYHWMEEAYDRFKKALGELEKIDVWKSDNIEQLDKEELLIKKYLLIAHCNCKRRMNEIYNILWDGIISGRSIQSFLKKKIENPQKIEEEQNSQKRSLWKKKFYQQEEIDEDIKKVLQIDSECFAVYAIRGFAAELDERQNVTAVNDLLQAVSMIGNKSYSSYLLYRIGKYYERMQVSENTMMKYYYLAYERDHNNYRALYKIAAQKQRNQQYEEAIKDWNKLLGILKERYFKGLMSLQPIECAYLYKTNRNKGRAYQKIGQYNQSIRSLKDALEIAEQGTKIDREDEFYPWMFGNLSEESDKLEKWKHYKKAARHKLELRRCYYDLATASSELNDIERNREYLLQMKFEEKREKSEYEKQENNGGE